MVKKIIDQIVEKIQSIPPLPAAVDRLYRLSKDMNTEVSSMAKIISGDPALTMKILKIANSAFYGLSHQIGTVSQAIMILGFQGVRNLALGASLLGVWNSKNSSAPISAEDFWRHSLATATAAKLLATHLNFKSPDEIFTAGLLHDIGKVVFLVYFPEQYASILQKVSDGNESLTSLEKKVFGVDHAEAGHHLCKHWKIPPLLTQSTANHHTPIVRRALSAEEDRITRLVQVANNLVKVAQIGYAGEVHVEAALLRDAESEEEIRQEHRRQVLLMLPDEVRKVEVFFSLLPSEGGIIKAEDDVLSVAHIIVRDSKERELISLAMLKLGHEPVLLERASEDEKNVICVITDIPQPASVLERWRGSSMKVLDYGQWKKDNSIVSEGVFHMHNLEKWLVENVPAKIASAPTQQTIKQETTEIKQEATDAKPENPNN